MPPSPPQPRLGRRVLFGVLFGVVVYAGIVVWLDWHSLLDALRVFPLWVAPAAMALAFGNYLIRFLKWERYRRRLGIEIDRPTSFTIYMAGFSMGITPGKMGEVFKSWLLRKVAGTPIHTSAPIVVAERVTDLFGYLILIAIGGLASQPDYWWLFGATLVLCAAGIVFVSSERSARWVVKLLGRTPFLWRFTGKAEGALASARILLAPRELLLPTLESVLSWGCECAAFWLVASQFVAGGIPFLFAVFAYATSAVAGAIALIFPGGLGITEAGLGALLRRKYEEVAGLPIEAARAKAGGAVLITRLCTLWFAVLLGLYFTARFERRYGRVTNADARPEAAGAD